jgi:hypothetical protein
MTIQFSSEEITAIRRYVDRVKSGETQKQLQGHIQDFPEWNTVFLILRKLLAYGVHYIVQTDPEISYPDLQKRSQKPSDMLVMVHAYSSQFEHLLTACTSSAS